MDWLPLSRCYRILLYFYLSYGVYLCKCNPFFPYLQIFFSIIQLLILYDTDYIQFVVGCYSYEA